MTKRALAQAASGCALAVLLGACAIQPRGDGIDVGSPLSCPGASCDLQVSGLPDADGQCRVQVDHDTADVAGRGVNMKWTLVSEGYKFGRYGIIINDYDPPREFVNPHFADTEVRWLNKNSIGGGHYKYSVHVTRNGVPCKVLDPWINNR